MVDFLISFFLFLAIFSSSPLSLTCIVNDEPLLSLQPSSSSSSLNHHHQPSLKPISSTTIISSSSSSLTKYHHSNGNITSQVLIEREMNFDDLIFSLSQSTISHLSHLPSLSLSLIIVHLRIHSSPSSINHLSSSERDK